MPAAAPPDLSAVKVYLYGFSFVFGAVWGSFLNVVIHRLPRRQSLVRPGSRCPSCEAPIRWHDNIPILGWLWLRGRCRACDVRISPRYPLVELLLGLLSLALAYKVFDARLAHEPIEVLLLAYLFMFVFVAALVTLFFIDLDRTELPPEITIPGIGVGLLYAWLVPGDGALYTLTPNPTLPDAAWGALVGGGIILVLFVLYFVLTGRVGLGGGDMWMMGMVGAFIGWQGLLFIYLASSVQGIAVALVAVALGHREGADASASDGAAGLFRNREVAELEAELRAAQGEPSASTAGDAQAPGADAPAAQDAAAGADPQAPGADASAAQDGSGDPQAPGFGKLAVPFGPFIALSAVEYLFVGHLVLPYLTGGMLGPNGFLF